MPNILPKHVLSALTAIPATLAELQTLTSHIDEAAKVQGTQTKGITQSKAAQKKSMANQPVVVGSALSVLATRTGNVELKDKVNYAPSDITRLTDTEAVVASNIIHELGILHLADATPYGLTNAALENLRTFIDSFNVLTGKRRSSQGTKVTATEDLEKLFAQADDLLDKLMISFKDSNPTLHRQYINARQIIDRGSRKKPGDDGKSTVK